MVRKGVRLNLTFQKSKWTFKLEYEAKKKPFHIISETSATSIWGNLSFWKHQALHWLLWQ